MNNILINHLFYADDAVLMATSPLVLQKLLNICSQYADEFELKFNVKKTKCLIFLPNCYNDLALPRFYLSGMKIETVKDIKYLGCYITDSLSDDKDISRIVRSIYSRGNTIIRKFYMCTENVKIKLFISFCTSFYGLANLSNFSQDSFRKISVAYKRIFRGFFMFKCDYDDVKRTSFHMLNRKIRPFPVIERNILHGFYTRVSGSTNDIVMAVFNCLCFNNSKFLTRYYNTVYLNQSAFR